MESWLLRITDYLLVQSWQIAILTIAVATTSFVLRNRSAHVRYLLWLIVLGKCLMPPLFSIPLAVLPHEQLAQPALVFPPAEMPAGVSEVALPVLDEPVKPAPVRAEVTTPPTIEQRPGMHNIRAWEAIVWVVGAAAFLFYNLLKALRYHIWLRRKRMLLPAELQIDIEKLCSAHGVKYLPSTWLIAGVSQPFVWGLVRGSVYLPVELLNVNDPKRWMSLLGHELSHVIRFDAAVNVLQVIAQVIFWFHPFVWWANKKIREEREKCCDEMTIVSLHALPEDYSEAIVEVLAAKYESIRPVPSLAVAGPVKNIEERIKTMLRPGKKFYKRPSLIAATVVLLSALLTVPTALVLTARAAEDATENEAESVKLLHQAAAKGDLERVKLLISKGADVNEKDKKGWSPLHSAASAAFYGQEDVAEVLIAKGANINTTDATGLTPLHVAAYWRSGHVLELLIAKGANVKARDKDGNTPLHNALRKKGGSVGERMLEFLLAKGSDVNARNDLGQTPLHLAAPRPRPEHRHVVAANFLLANGADINAKDKYGSTPLYMAARNDRKDIVELLLSKGAIISEKNYYKEMTALHAASAVGNRDVVECLLNKEADANAIQWSGWTALHYAARAGNNDIVELLLSKGADVNAKNIRGETPAHLAVVQNHKDTVTLLISKGAEISTIQLAAYIGDLDKVKSFVEKDVSISAQDGYWLTPLHAAAGTGQREVAELLISKGALVNADAVSEGPGTPLQYAADGGSKDVAELLISKGSSVNARNKDRETPLHLAAKRGYKDVTQLLIAKKADVNAKTQDGRTPLHHAVQNGHKDVMAILIGNGADVNAKDRDDLRPLDVAAQSEDKNVVKLLFDSGADVSVSVDLLYYAVWKGHRDLVELLIKKGADVNTEEEGWTYALSLYAEWGNHPDVLELLLAHGALMSMQKTSGAGRFCITRQTMATRI